MLINFVEKIPIKEVIQYLLLLQNPTGSLTTELKEVFKDL